MSIAGRPAEPRPTSPQRQRKPAVAPALVVAAWQHECKARGERGAFSRVGMMYGKTDEWCRKIVRAWQAEAATRSPIEPSLQPVAAVVPLIAALPRDRTPPEHVVPFPLPAADDELAYTPAPGELEYERERVMLAWRLQVANTRKQARMRQRAEAVLAQITRLETAIDMLQAELNQRVLLEALLAMPTEEEAEIQAELDYVNCQHRKLALEAWEATKRQLAERERPRPRRVANNHIVANVALATMPLLIGLQLLVTRWSVVVGMLSFPALLLALHLIATAQRACRAASEGQP